MDFLESILSNINDNEDVLNFLTLTKGRNYKSKLRVVRNPPDNVLHIGGKTIYRVNYYSDGWKKREEGGYVDGEKERRWRGWYPSGKPATDVVYHRGLLQGPYHSWRSNGVPFMETSYYRGKMHGSYKEYFADGTVEMEGWYENGRKTGLFKYRSATGVDWEIVH
jgi:antitoxin component YwqK of YwqJK toxin-antitoxin module